MKKIVFLDADTLGDVSLSAISAHGILTRYGTSTQQQAAERVKDAQVLIVNKVHVTDALMACAPHLELICEAATGVNNIDMEAAQRRSIAVRNVAGYSTDSVVQLTFTQILNLFMRPWRFDREVKDGTYSRSGLFTDVSSPYPEISGKTIGIIGMGTIGHKVADVASVFGMHPVYYPTSGIAHCADWPCMDLRTLLQQSDVVSVHAPLNDRTRGLVSMAQLRMMKPSAFIVNMARGGIVDEASLAQALDDGVIAGAALDVFTEEPLPEGSPLLRMRYPERLLMTPHVAWASREAILRLVEGISENIRTFYGNI